MYQGKVDLHLHLDGSLSEPFMRDRLREYGLPVPDDLHKAMAAPPVCHDLADYLKMFHLAGSVLQCADALEACAFGLVGRLAEQGLIYAEIRFAPALHLASGLTQEEAVELGAKRIGHGVAALRSADCMALLRERGTVVECCYSSNLQTRTVPSPERHPIRAFF